MEPMHEPCERRLTRRAAQSLAVASASAAIKRPKKAPDSAEGEKPHAAEGQATTDIEDAPATVAKRSKAPVKLAGEDLQAPGTPDAAPIAKRSKVVPKLETDDLQDQAALGPAQAAPEEAQEVTSDSEQPAAAAAAIAAKLGVEDPQAVVSADQAATDLGRRRAAKPNPDDQLPPNKYESAAADNADASDDPDEEPMRRTGSATHQVHTDSKGKHKVKSLKAGRIILLSGTSSSGKSTLVREQILKRHPSIVYMSADLVFDQLKREILRTPYAQLKPLVPGRLADEAKKSKAKGYTVLVDDNSVKLLSLLPGVQVVVLFADLQNLAVRARSRRGGDRRPLNGIIGDFAELYTAKRPIPTATPVCCLARSDVQDFLNRDSTLTAAVRDKALAAASKKMGLPVTGSVGVYVREPAVGAVVDTSGKTPDQVYAEIAPLLLL